MRKHKTAENDINEIQADAIKEFAERLKKRSLTKWDYHEAVDVEDINSLVMEMTGEKDA